MRERHSKAKIVVHYDMNAAVDDGASPHWHAPIAHGENAEQRQRGVMVHVKKPKLFLAKNEQQCVDEVVVLAQVKDVAPEE